MLDTFKYAMDFLVLIILFASLFFMIKNRKRDTFFAKFGQTETEKDLQRFKLAVENASDHIVITDKDGVIVYANKSVKRITGFDSYEVIGKKAGSKDLWGGLMDENFYRNMWQTIKFKKEPFYGEIKNKRKDGSEYYAYSSISPVVDKSGEVQFFVGIERDITKEKEIDKAKTEFVSLASHQLRTPLSAISWYTEMLLNGDAGAINDKQKEYLNEVYYGNQRMIDLVNALLNVSRIEMGSFVIEPEMTDIVSIFRSVMDESKPKIDEKRLILHTDFQKNLPKVFLDKKLIRIVLQNLLTNAIKYTPESGNIFLMIFVKDEKLVISIRDEGFGIPLNEQDKIFNKLFRATNVKEKETDGTGLGLYIVKSILDNSGGSISFDSKEDKGSTFTVSIPISGMHKKDGERQLG